MSDKTYKLDRDDGRLKDQITIKNKTTFMLSLREGMGLGHSCVVSDNDPKDISTLIRNVESFRTECNKAVSAANFDLLKISSEFMQDNKYEKAYEARAKAEKISKLTLWEEYGTEEDLDSKLLLAVAEVSHARDIAIGFGMSYQKYLEYISENPGIIDAIERYKKALNGR